MKNCIQAILVLVTSILLIQCNKSTDNKPSITGMWILSEYYMDPGDGSGKWQAAPKTNPEWLNFKANKQLESGNSGTLSTYSQYEVLSDSTLLFTSGQGSSIQVRYNLTNDLLTITPSCIEGCGFKYNRPKL